MPKLLFKAVPNQREMNLQSKDLSKFLQHIQQSGILFKERYLFSKDQAKNKKTPERFVFPSRG